MLTSRRIDEDVCQEMASIPLLDEDGNDKTVSIPLLDLTGWGGKTENDYPLSPLSLGHYMADLRSDRRFSHLMV